MSEPIRLDQVLTGPEVGRAFGELGLAGHARAQLDESVLTNVQGGINPIITGLMRGFPRPATYPGQVLFRQVGVPTVSFKFRKFARERFFEQDTRRAMNAPFRTGKRTYETDSGSLERRGFVTLADRDEVHNARQTASGLVPDFEVRKMVEARDQVENDLEGVRAALVLDTANYGLTPVTLGTPWDNASGDSRADIQTEAWKLAAANNVQPMQIGVLLTHASYEAAQSDPTMIAALTAGGGGLPSGLGRTPTADDMRQYWGVGEVVVADYFRTPDGDAFASAYGDIAVLYLLRQNLTVEARETTNDAAVDFVWAQAPGGLALEPVYKNVEIQGVATSWLFPFESWNSPAVVNPDAWHLVQNTKT